MQITNHTAQQIVNTVTDTTSTITASQIVQALRTVKGATFATLTQASQVKTAAAHRSQNIYKITVQNVTLCNSDASLYSNAVARETEQAFTAMPSNYDMINNSYSVCSLKSNPAKHYLRAIVNKCLQVAYYCANTNAIVSKADVAPYLTNSAREQLLNPSTSTHVAHADVVHTVTARTFALQNIYSINVNKQSLTA
jgi:hypothetical protein